MVRGAHAGRGQRRGDGANSAVSRAGAAVEIAWTAEARAGCSRVDGAPGGTAEGGARVDRKAAANLCASEDRAAAQLESVALGEVIAERSSRARRSMEWCAADPGSSETRSVRRSHICDAPLPAAWRAGQAISSVSPIA